MTDAPGLIVTGMHRSGTSLAAQAFSAAGFQVGGALVPPRRPNPRGYFEPQAIVDLHRRLLRRSGYRGDDRRGIERSRATRPSAALEAEAAEVLAAEFEGREPWAWKDPRASLFLPMWKRIVPSARFVFLVRRPAAVAWSLLRRGDRFGQGFRARVKGPLWRALYAVDLWTAYNRRILDFALEHPEDCTIILVPDDIRADVDPRLAYAFERWRIPLPPPDLAAARDPALLTVTAPRWVEAVARRRDGAEPLYRELAQLRDRLPSEEGG